MKKTIVVIASMVTLFLPIIVIGIVYLMKGPNIFDNPDFWYGYMAYFGTVSLAAVAFWQNESANLINKRLADMSCKEKIAYLVPKKYQIIRGDMFEFEFFKRGNSFGFFQSYNLYIDDKLVMHKSLDDFYEETNTEESYRKFIDLSRYKLSENHQILMEIYWRNQYGFKYVQNVIFNFRRDKRIEDGLISEKNVFEIKYLDEL